LYGYFIYCQRSKGYASQYYEKTRQGKKMTLNTEQPKRQEACIHDYDGALTEQIIAGRIADIHGAPV
jgi:hypothetical protein